MRTQPDNDRDRPAANRTASNVNYDDTTSIPAQVRRRRDAAHRSAPLPTGYRDPFDAAAAKPFKPASITHDSAARVFRVKGYGVRDVLRAAGMKPIQTVGGFLLDLYRLPDAVAALEHAGYRVSMREGVV